MSSNRGVVISNPERSKFRRSIFQPFRNPAGKEIDRGVILNVVSINICGSDQHMVRGRTTAPAGMVLRHEITGEVIEGIAKISTNWRKDPREVGFQVAVTLEICLHVAMAVSRRFRWSDDERACRGKWNRLATGSWMERKR
jgi:threonine dehydrogenase-like Zn-dependent dehydrogenase